jgi:hypothetical protein
MSSAFERMQKIAEEKRLREQAEKPRLELVEDTQPTQHTQPNISNVTNPTYLTNPTSPKNDYTKVANSIAREAVPDRLFKGMSKNTYDALYLKTRGAHNPVRKIRATKSDLLRWTGVSDVTLDKHIRHLKSVGLVKVDFIIGSHNGNWYEVFIPEEMELPNQPNQPNQPDIPKKVGGDPPNLVGGVGGVLLLENKEVMGNAKTSLKTNTKSDDEADALFSGFIEKFQTAAKKLTGAPLSKYEREKWERLAELLVLELETASRHASNPVSSVPAFLTKVLSSKLLNQKQPEHTSKSKSGTKLDTVGKYYPELDDSDEEVKSLDTESKEAAVDLLREFKDDAEFLEGYKKWYTEEDWSWVIKELKIKK